PVPNSEMRATLERWLGPIDAGADLPLPAMIDVDLAAGADPAAIGRRIEVAVPGARFVAHADSLRPLLSALHAVSLLAVALVLLVALASGAVVVLAARGALDTNRATIEIMHGVGASDAQVAALFQRRIAIDALTGGVSGGLVAGLVLLVILGGGSSWIAELSGGSLLHARDLLLLALLPFAVAALATLVARAAVLSALRSSL
ncbi:MAG: permease, partial [Sphingomicrobium sp.]